MARFLVSIDDGEHVDTSEDVVDDTIENVLRWSMRTAALVAIEALASSQEGRRTVRVEILDQLTAEVSTATVVVATSMSASTPVRH